MIAPHWLGVRFLQSGPPCSVGGATVSRPMLSGTFGYLATASHHPCIDPETCD
jgi:hypothetical protein